MINRGMLHSFRRVLVIFKLIYIITNMIPVGQLILDFGI